MITFRPSTIAIAAALALAGCASHNEPTPAGVAMSAISSTTHNPIAAYSDYETRDQLAEGIDRAGIAAMAIGNYYGIYGKFPESTAQAESVEPWYAPKFDGPEGQRNEHVGSVTVGTAPGRITVVWSRGALAGEALVLVPDPAGRPCFRLDIASTTVPVAALAHANIGDRCYDDIDLHEAALAAPAW